MTKARNNTPDELPTTWVRVSHHTPKHMTMYPYAAYGSNLMLSQIAERCPQVDIVGAGQLHGAKLRFNRVATIVESKDHFIPVGVYKLSETDIHRLDMREGMGRIYDRFLVTVDMGDRMMRCFTYIKRASYEATPTEDYYAKLARGYKDWAFPDRRLRRARESALEADRKWGARYRYEPTSSSADTYTRHSNWVNNRDGGVNAALDRLRKGTRPQSTPPSNDMPLFQSTSADPMSSNNQLPVVHKPRALPDKPEEIFYNPEKKELWGKFANVWRRMKSFAIPRDGIPEALIREPEDVRMNPHGELEGLYNGEWRRIRS